MRIKLFSIFAFFAQLGEPSKFTKQVNPSDLPEYWRNYNKKAAQEGDTVTVVRKNGNPEQIFSYTEDAFNVNNLYKNLNNQSTRMLALGASASTKKFFKKFKEQGWNITTYDYSKVAVDTLKGVGVKAIEVDLNSYRDDTVFDLTYANRLRNDISKPTNIILVRILQYLNFEPFHLLLLNLINYAAPGSRLFLTVYDDPSIKMKNIPQQAFNMVTSYFAPCTHVTFFENKKINSNERLLVIGINERPAPALPENGPTLKRDL